MSIVDKSYNYLNDLNCGNFVADSLSIELRSIGGEEKWIRTINNKPYKDPDSKSKKLYEDLSLIYNGLKLPNENYIESVKIEKRNKDKKNCFYEIVINIINVDKDTKTIIAQIGLGADYIGPSLHWACEAGLNSIEIGAYLQTTRTIGGHFLWPRWIGIPKKIGQTGYNFINEFKSINKYKGGEKGFFDRIDLTLFDLKAWYSEQTCEFQNAYDKNKVWLEQFVDFKQFVDFFKMNDYVSEEGYDIKNICTFSKGKHFNYLESKDVYPASIPRDRIKFSTLADASVHLTNLRNARIFIP